MASRATRSTYQADDLALGIDAAPGLGSSLAVEKGRHTLAARGDTRLVPSITMGACKGNVLRDVNGDRSPYRNSHEARSS